MARRHYGNQTEDITPQERDLQQLLGLAQLHQLMTQPELESQHLEQTDQANRMTAAIHLLGLQQEAEQKQSALEEQQKLREASVKGNVMDSLISHLSQRSDVPLSTLADTLEKGGHGELATTLRTAHVEDVKKKAAVHLGNIKALGSDPKKVDTYLTAIGNDPEVAAAVKAALPTTTVPTTPETSFATSIGKAARIGLDPGAAIAAGLRGVYEYGKTAQGPRDFWEALLNKKLQPATQ